jgi:hypothetical protein
MNSASRIAASNTEKSSHFSDTAENCLRSWCGVNGGAEAAACAHGGLRRIDHVGASDARSGCARRRCRASTMGSVAAGARVDCAASRCHMRVEHNLSLVDRLLLEVIDFDRSDARDWSAQAANPTFRLRQCGIPWTHFTSAGVKHHAG